MIRMSDGIHYFGKKKKSASIAVKRAKERRDGGGKYIGRMPILKMCKVFVECMKVRDTLNIEIADLPVVLLPLAICRPVAAAVAGG